MWHPDDASPKELDAYDQVYVASAQYAEIVGAETSVPVAPMLQCSDTARFAFGQPDRGTPRHDILFVGNSRNVYREVLRWCVEEGIDVAVYGDGWESFLPAHMIKGSYVPNDLLGALYGRARLVLCDHWAAMRRRAFISNRVFDVLGAGGNLVVDDVPGLSSAVPGGYKIYRTKDDLIRIIGEAWPRNDDEKREISEWIAKNHSFRIRAQTLIRRAEELLSQGGRRSASVKYLESLERMG